MKRTKQQWTEQEIQLLTDLTKNNRTEQAKQINWSEIAKNFPNRTENTIKSYYSNILKKNLNAFIRKNHQWTKDEILRLWSYTVTYNSDFQFIQQNFMNQFSVKQLQSQFVQLKYRHGKYLKDFEEMLKNMKYAQNISTKLLLQEGAPKPTNQLIQLKLERPNNSGHILIQNICMKQLSKNKNEEEQTMKKFKTLKQFELFVKQKLKILNMSE
ncbi:SANT/Myb_domain [Hexamita inflata]|uniref:SANT/Myb domain n=1 Tax=Hexamita inflata TaxID=28002 RepID=A0AA86UKL0_9EUKA|nr:SANT/Myb domain [Hexamita inflata]CAI9954867.1 SANT/Myb domain [Hexamita inflata]